MANEKKMDCVILGLLAHESLTGYEIKKRMDTALKFFWSASYGSIYPTLNGLVNDGLVTKYETKDNGRDKLIYTITEDGREFLQQWLSIPSSKDELRYETLLKLFFGNELGAKGTLQNILSFEEKIKAELPFLMGAVQNLSQVVDLDETHRYYLMTAKFGVTTYQAYLSWCEEVKKMLGEEN